MGGPLLRIALQCPKCGAPFEIDDETRSVHCDHCNSLLLLEAPERAELYVADGRLRAREQLLEILVEYRVQAQRAEIIARHSDSDGNPPSELFIASRLAAFERELRGHVRLLEAHCLHVPYWHLTGAIVHGILGRRRDSKTTGVRSFAVEHTVPGYDETQANLRDRGLRLDQTLARPLTAAAVAAGGRFLPRVPLQERRHREIDKWLQRDLDKRLEPIAKHAAFLAGPQLLVYRPYWLAHMITDKAQEWILFDASFLTIAGYPSEPEARALLRLVDKDPLGKEKESFRRVSIVPSRCPDCGFEESYDRRASLIVCPNCHRALQLGRQGPQLVGYEHAVRGEAGLEAAWLPFWRYPFSAELKDKTKLASIDDYRKALFPQPPAGFRLSGRHLFVPAFRLLGTEPGDELFKDLCEWIHDTPPSPREGKLPIGGRPRLVGVSVGEPEARRLAPFVLVGLHNKVSAARLNRLLLTKTVSELRLSLGEPTLVMVPFDRAGDDVAITERQVRIPALLLERRPELLQMRATVVAAQARAE